MGLLGDFGKAIVDEAKGKVERYNKYLEDLEYYDDERLMKVYRNSSGERKLAAAELLKRRGYGN